MLDLSRYLLGVLELLLLAGSSWAGGSAIRARLVPGFSGASAHLAAAVLAFALLTLTAELLGSFGLFDPMPYLIAVTVAGVICGTLLRRVARRRRPPLAEEPAKRDPSTWGRAALTGPAGRATTAVALVVAALAMVKFGIDVRSKLMTGMTGFDSTWYHGPFAAGFFQSGDTWGLHFIAPQFLAWFYPANAEIFHAAGMLAFGRDVLSPLLNLGWLAGCLVACWCIGRPYRVAPWSLALGAIALSLPVLSDQAGEARNDIVGIFFLLAAVAIALNAWSPSVSSSPRISRERANAAVVIGLVAGLAAGTKLNFLLPAAVLVLGLPLLAPAGQRLRALVAAVLAALAGGGYWYLRNLIQSGNPLPWFDHLGPISLPAPEQALGGREGHSVLGYLTDGSVWSEWFLPGLHGGLTILWPAIAALAISGLVLPLAATRSASRNDGPSSRAPSRFDLHTGANLDGGWDVGLLLVGLTGLAVVVAWLLAPTSASGPDGMPRGFESGLRYLAPAIVLGLAVLPASLLPRVARRWGSPIAEGARSASEHMGEAAATGPTGQRAWRRAAIAAGASTLVAAIAIGYPAQRHYLKNRYADPTFAAPGLNAAFKWANGVSGARIATTSTRQYPLFGTDLSNRVQYVGEEQPHGGFMAPINCKQWRHMLNAGHYDYVVTTRDRVEEGKPPFPDSTRWTEGLGVEEVLRLPPTVVFKLKGPLDPVACRGREGFRP